MYYDLLTNMSTDMNNQVFRFRDFPVYNQAREYRKKLKDISKVRFAKEEKFRLSDQLWRALDSIILNIAEGTDRYSGKSNSKFLNYSIGSLDEVIGCIDCAFDDGYISQSEQISLISEGCVIMRQLKALSATIRRNERKN